MDKIVCQNRKARFNYFILDTFEAGMVLVGTEVALALMLLTGSVLFTAEASHVGTNRVFQVKATLIVLGLSNAVFSGRTVQPLLDSAPAFAPMPRRVRLSAYFSLGIWVCVAACGRLIAYF